MCVFLEFCSFSKTGKTCFQKNVGSSVFFFVFFFEPDLVGGCAFEAKCASKRESWYTSKPPKAPKYKELPNVFVILIYISF